ncbi:MAG: hypothetical protein C0424_06540 [Sphingobacteriaceae bacterium]|nr:hypothetical protein [Sphingobacteriaceae bacterium]
MTQQSKLLLCVLLFGFFTSCKEPKALKNYNASIVPFDSMTLLMAEVQLIESHRNRSFQQAGRDTMPLANVRAMYDQVLMRYGVDYERFRKSYDYYQQQHPAVLDSLFTGVNQRLNEMLTNSYR